MNSLNASHHSIKSVDAGHVVDSCHGCCPPSDKDAGRKALAKLKEAPSVGHILNEMFEAVGEATLVQPTFVLEHPTEISPLAKPHRSKAGVTERCVA